MNASSQPRPPPDELLQPGRWYAGLDPDVRQAMLDGGTVKRVKRGRALFRRGDKPAGLFAVLDGQVHSQGESNDGKTIVLAIFHPPDWLGFLPCADGRPHAFDTIASTDSNVFFVPVQLVRSLFHSNPERYIYLLAPQLNSLRKIYFYLTNTIHLKPIERLAFRLLDFARSPWYVGGVTHPVRGLSQDLLAASILSNRQDTNKMLRELEEQGLIRKSYNQIEIIDATGLEKLAKTNT